MNSGRIVLKVLCAGMAALLVAPVHAEKAGKTIQGEPFVSGGIGADEQAALKKDLSQYNLWIQTAAKSGPFLSDATVKIVDEADTVVLDTQLDGPWLIVKLGPGQYKVAVTYGGKTVERSTQIHPGDHHQMIFYFDANVDVLPKGEER